MTSSLLAANKKNKNKKNHHVVKLLTKHTVDRYDEKKITMQDIQ